MSDRENRVQLYCPELECQVNAEIAKFQGGKCCHKTGFLVQSKRNFLWRRHIQLLVNERFIW